MRLPWRWPSTTERGVTVAPTGWLCCGGDCMETTSWHPPPLLPTVPDGAHLSPHTAGQPTPGGSGGLLATSRCYPAPSPSPTSPHSEPRGPAGEQGCSHPNCQREQMGPGQTDGMQPCLCGCRTCSSRHRFSKFWDFMASAASDSHWPPDRQYPIDTGQGVSRNKLRPNKAGDHSDHTPALACGVCRSGGGSGWGAWAEPPQPDPTLTHAAFHPNTQCPKGQGCTANTIPPKGLMSNMEERMVNS